MGMVLPRRYDSCKMLCGLTMAINLNYGGALILVIGSFFHLELPEKCSKVEHLFCNQLLLNNVGEV